MQAGQVLLITPPFTQINTPYPATCYLKGFLQTIGVFSYQVDLSIEVFLKIYSREGLKRIFNEVEETDPELSENAFRIWTLKDAYVSTIDFVIDFLQNQRSTLAYRIAGRDFLPMASRFDHLEEIEDGFGVLSLIDKSKYFATLYLEDLADFIKETVDPYFGFSRYAEKIASSLSSFDQMEGAIRDNEFITIQFLREIVVDLVRKFQPKLVAITVPFPGNLFSALKCAQFIKLIDPEIKIVLGGGYCNTELRSLTDERIFSYVDFITLDDGEAPLQCLLEYINGLRDSKNLKRTFLLHNQVVQFCNGAIEKDIPQREVGTPDYSDLHLTKYLSVLEVANPMHRLWSDGRWNKLTIAHGCYWGKCTFCDITLDYIARYEPVNASLLCDRIETLVDQTGERGFHFVDEAAPPAMMRDLAIELIRRNLCITWWANIRFENTFDDDLCRLLAASGCVAVSGGLEVASDRLLKLIQKGVTVDQVTRVAHSFTQAGIMVHAYLMYGFPTQTEQETMDALEVVRQLFEHDVIQSGFWHLFSMTAHSPVGRNPAIFNVEKSGPLFEGFAENDYLHSDATGADHEKFSEGLKTSLFNYLNAIGLDKSLDFWFPFTVPKTAIPKNLIRNIISQKRYKSPSSKSRIYWIGGEPCSSGENGNEIVLTFINRENEFQLRMSREIYLWFIHIFPELEISNEQPFTFDKLKRTYEGSLSRPIENLLKSITWKILRKEGLLVI